MRNRWNARTNCFGILILWLLYINSVQCFQWTPSSYRNLTRFRRQSSRCNFDEFTCRDGSCIKDDLQCDGKNDCSDGSDESVECRDVRCDAAFGYRCQYGACVPINARCNGVRDCNDGSDEKDCPGNQTPPTNTGCATTQFACLSGNCIDDVKACDGHADCLDNSDETQQVCTGLPCINSYRCKYGACVAKNARCNGVRECFDGSDEQGCPTTSKPPTPTPKPSVKPPPPEGGCLVPKAPDGGSFEGFKPGDYATSFVSLLTKCKQGFTPSPPDRNPPICFNGKWNGPPLDCSRSCPPPKPSKTTKVTCLYKGERLKSCESPIDGTIATIECQYLHEHAQSGQNPNRICRDGTWDYPIPECRPKCGQKRPKGKPNLVNGRVVKEGDYPWHIGVYANDDKKSYLCGGSIINPVLIISAAHCFTEHNEGKQIPKENYLIATGKYYRPYDDTRDQNTAQYSTVKQIHIPDRYRGRTGNYEADIAVVILTKAFTITVSVQPVCIDWSNDFETQQLSENNVGVIIGWGFTIAGDVLAVELRELDVPYISNQQCFERIRKDFRSFLTYDKVCAGYLYKGTSVCQGDSGGGLTFPRKSDDSYFLRGIVSTSPDDEGTCDINQFATYTLVSAYLDFIKYIELFNRV